ncbi:MAG: PIN domain-containing protein [Microthrixaceae bacterium]|nr:PIN domain-containing protein [Microthrixaceae bacterium]
MSAPPPVLDASALLAFLQGEEGADTVEHALEAGAVCGAANWSEVAQKVGRRGDWPTARALLQSYDLAVEPVAEADAERAAERRAAAPSVSLADCLCLCLALADRLGAVALTSDSDWAHHASVELIG